MGETFSKGRESVTDEERSGWPATSRKEEMLQKFIKFLCSCFLVLFLNKVLYKTA